MEISSAKDDGYNVLETDGDNMVQDCQMEETKENQPSSTNLKTKLAVALEKCLGPSLCIQQLDQLRYKIKNKSKSSHTYKAKHKELILSLKEKLLTQKQELKIKIKTYEDAFYIHNLPNTSDSTYKQLLTSRRLLNHLLESADFKI